jgi:hypothetical protein
MGPSPRLSLRLVRRLCRWLVLPLLFMQLAAPAHACIGSAAAGGAAAVAPAALPDCHGDRSHAFDADLPQLCKAHCEQGQQVVGVAAGTDWTPWPLLVAVIDWQHAARAPWRASPHWRAGPPLGGAPPGSPALYLSLLVLRN